MEAKKANAQINDNPPPPVKVNYSTEKVDNEIPELINNEPLMPVDNEVPKQVKDEILQEGNEHPEPVNIDIPEQMGNALQQMMVVLEEQVNDLPELVNIVFQEQNDEIPEVVDIDAQENGAFPGPINILHQDQGNDFPELVNNELQEEGNDELPQQIKDAPKQVNDEVIEQVVDEFPEQDNNNNNNQLPPVLAVPVQDLPEQVNDNRPQQVKVDGSKKENVASLQGNPQAEDVKNTSSKPNETTIRGKLKEIQKLAESIKMPGKEIREMLEASWEGSLLRMRTFLAPKRKQRKIEQPETLKLASEKAQEKLEDNVMIADRIISAFNEISQEAREAEPPLSEDFRKIISDYDRLFRSVKDMTNEIINLICPPETGEEGTESEDESETTSSDGYDSVDEQPILLGGPAPIHFFGPPILQGDGAMGEESSEEEDLPEF